MKVTVISHYGAALLRNEENKTLLLQDEGDQLEILGEEWESGDEIEILDEYEELFE